MATSAGADAAQYSQKNMRQFNLNYGWNPETLGRRSALVLGILLSGGNLIFPRFPLLFLLATITLITINYQSLPLYRVKLVLTTLLAILLLWIIRPGPHDLVSLSIRYANFTAALFLLLFYIKKNNTQLAEDLTWLMPWIAYQTLLTFLLANSVPNLFTKIQTSDGGSFNTILLIFNYHNFIEDYSGWNRPNSVFFEPGVLQIYLNLYLYISLFIFKKKKDAALAAIAILSTISTVGTVIAGVQLAIYFKATWRTEKPRTRRLIAAGILIISPLWITLSIKNIEDKFFGEARGSSMARTFDLIAGIQVTANNPILGIGFDHKRYLAETANLPNFATDFGYEKNPERPTSNGLLNITYSLGIPLAAIFLFGLFRQRALPHGKAVGVIIFACSISEALLFTPFFLLFIFSGLLIKSKAPASITHVQESVNGASTPSSS